MKNDIENYIVLGILIILNFLNLFHSNLSFVFFLNLFFITILTVVELFLNRQNKLANCIERTISLRSDETGIIIGTALFPFLFNSLLALCERDQRNSQLWLHFFLYYIFSLLLGLFALFHVYLLRFETFFHRNRSILSVFTCVSLCYFLSPFLLDTGFFDYFSFLFLVYIFSGIFSFLLENISESFTLGEAIIFAIPCSLILWNGLHISLQRWFSSVYHLGTFTMNIQTMPTEVAHISLAWILFFSFILYSFIMRLFPVFFRSQSMKNKLVSCIFILSTILFSYWNSMIIKENLFLWYITHLFGTSRHFFLLLYWACALFVMVLGARFFRSALNLSPFALRKWFHVIALVIFVPGILFDLSLLDLTLGLVLFIFFTVECLRSIGLLPKPIAQFMNAFIDEKDQGSILTTHIWLLLGCSIPIFITHHFSIHSDPCFHVISSFSGLLAVGIGDTFASMIGKKYGKKHWPRSKKTLEGSLASFLTIFFSSLLLIVTFYSNSFVFSLCSVFSLAVAAFLTSILEAITNQIDNVIISLYFFLFLQFFTFCT